jgi:23S rRNA pseudouridine2605 synthase/23S rRNA pseudouridine2604 synthase
VQWPLADQALAVMEKGMPLSGVMTRPARVRRVSGNRFRIVLMEGKNRQIRRMVKKVGNRVVRLHRIRVADLKLGDLGKGSWRHLRPVELRQMLKQLGLQKSNNNSQKPNDK